MLRGGSRPGREALRASTSSSAGGAAFLNSLVNHEQRGLPPGSGAATPQGFELGPMRSLLARLGDPQDAWPVVHVAGTKGKGSTAAFLAAMLTAAGYRTGLYTSPHVTHLGERIALDGEPLSPQGLDGLVDRYRAALEAGAAPGLGPGPGPGPAGVSHFEALTALAFRHFADSRADVAVVEVGLGGARDATNVFSPRTLQAAVITPLGLEHEAALGQGLRNIARAKAGILKAGRPVVLAEQPPEAEAELLAAAAELGCPVTHARDEVEVVAEGGLEEDERGRLLQRCTVRLKAPEAGEEAELGAALQLLGVHQLQNAAVAVATARLLQRGGFGRLGPAAWGAGLARASLPGRFQTGRVGGVRSVLDGAHTAESGAALATALRAAYPTARLGLVLAMAADKDAGAFFGALRAAQPCVVAFTSAPIAGASHREAPAGQLAAHWQALEARGTPGGSPRGRRCRQLVKASVAAAFEAVARDVAASPGDGPVVVCVTGSLHAVAQALRTLTFEGG